jgi:hypothetical protein
MSALPTAQRRLDACAAKFMGAVETTRLSPALEHTAENCAFICAGGCMAVVLRAIRSCFRDLLQARSEDEQDPLSAAKRLFRRRLEIDVIYRQERPNDAFHASAYDGYVAKEGQSPVVSFARQACGSGSRRKDKANRPSDWAERTLVWPDGKHVRSIVFYDPFAR